MTRIIRPYVRLSHLNHRFGQRCGWAPNCLIADGGGSAPFDPDILPSILQNLGSPLTYRESLLSGLPVIESSVGASAAVPRGQRCYLADGVNDTIVWTAANTGTQYVTYYNPATASWVAPVALTHNGSAYVFAPGNIRFFNLKRWSISNPTDAQIRATTLAAAQGSGVLVSWHWCQEESGTVARDVANATPREGTLTNVDTASFHSTHVGVDFSGPNELGYTLSGSVVIPRNEADISKDAAGGALQFTGPVKLPGVVEVPCITFSGTDYATLGARLTSGSLSSISAGAWVSTTNASSLQKIICGEYTNTGNQRGWLLYLDTTGRARILVSINGSTLCFRDSNIAVNDGLTHHVAASFDGANLNIYIDGVLDNGALTGTIPASIFSSTASFEIGRINNDLFWPGRISSARVYSGAKSGAQWLAIAKGFDDRTNLLAHWPIQEGPGSSNTNRTIYDTSGNGRHLTVVNGTVSTQWANRTNVVRDHCIEHGGGIAANGAFVPGIPGSPNDAAGNVKTLAAGKHGNPYSRRIMNQWNVPSMVSIGARNFGNDVRGSVTSFSAARNPVVSTKVTGLTMSCWLKWNGVQSLPIFLGNTDVGTNGYAFIVGDGSGGNGNRLGVLAGGLLFDIFFGGGPALVSGQWVHLTLTHNAFGGIWRLYTNGSLTTNNTTSVNAQNANSRTRLNTTAGALADVRWYDRDLSAAEALTLSQGGVVSATSLVAQYTLNQQSGVTALDSSGNGRDLVSASAAWNYIERDLYAPGQNERSEPVADTRYARNSASGDDRCLAFREALTGSDLANVEEWTQ
jgi:hypothetical protein